MVQRCGFGGMELSARIAAMGCQVYRCHTSFRRINDCQAGFRELGQISLGLVVLRVLVYAPAEDSLP